jgi:hypothetical protein
VLRPPALADEEHAADDDQDGAEQQRRVQRLVEEDERDHDGEERGRADGDGGARRPGVSHCEREEELREAGAEHAGEHEGPDAGEVDGLRGHERQRHRERGQDRQQGSDLGVRDAAEGEAKRDRHGSEEEGRGEREQDGVHGASVRGCRAQGLEVKSPRKRPPDGK